MKKQYVLFLMITILIGVTACGKKAPTWQEQYDLGVKYLSEGNYKEAIIAFSAAIAIDSKQSLAYERRGDAYISSGETEENLMAAQSDYLEVLKLVPTNSEIYIKLSEVYLAIGNPNAAQAILQQGYEVTGDERLFEKLNEIKIDLGGWNLLTSEQRTLLSDLDKATREYDAESVRQIMSSEQFMKIYDYAANPADIDGNSGYFELALKDGSKYGLSFWSSDDELDYWFYVFGSDSYSEAVYWTKDNQIGISHMNGQTGNETGEFRHIVFLPDNRSVTSIGTASNGVRVGVETVTNSIGDTEIYEYDQQGNLQSYSGKYVGNFDAISAAYPMPASTYRVWFH